MKTFKDLLTELNGCEEAIKWTEDKTIEQVVERCHRGDWLLWLARKIDIDLQPLTLAKGHCANTVRHLIKKERRKAVDAAIAFGEGKITVEELDAAAAAGAGAGAYYVDDAAVYAAIAFGEGKITVEELDAAAVADAGAGAYVVDDAAVYAANVAFAAAYRVYPSAAHPSAAYAGPVYSAPLHAAVGAAAEKKENEQLTANICRKYIGQLIIDKVNEKL